MRTTQPAGKRILWREVTLAAWCGFVFGCSSSHQSTTTDLNQLIESVTPAAVLQAPTEIAASGHGEHQLHASEQTLTLTAAVHTAVNNNPSITQQLSRINVAQADIYQAARIRNPVFGTTNLRSRHSDDRPFSALNLMLSVSDVITRPSRLALAQKNAEVIHLEVAAEILALTTRTQRAYYRYAHAKHSAAVKAEIHAVTALTLQLAERFHAAGNLTDLELAEKRTTAAHAHVVALKAETDVTRTRAQFAELLGLPMSGQWQTTNQLPTATVDITPEQFLAEARKNRLDLRAAESRIALLGEQYDVVKWQRWTGDAALTAEQERETDGAKLLGAAFEIELPVFTQHEDEITRAQAEWADAKAHHRQLQLAVENQTLTAAATLTAVQRQLAVYQQALFPAQADVLDGAVRRQNYMLTGGFSVLERKLAQLHHQADYVDTLGEYWATWSSLCEALGGAATDLETEQLPEPSKREHSMPSNNNQNHHHH
ncbi:MAG: TolC family protein [Pseudomonadota bacterium]|nr:TolC family protein [Pseudomonadota bacterium]